MSGAVAPSGRSARPALSARSAPDQVPAVYEYAVLRVIPRIERGEAMNVGVVVTCRDHDFLGCRTHLDRSRLLALDPELDLAGVEAALRAVQAICAGGEQAGQAGAEPAGGRFRWLTAPRSTIVQPGPVHAGRTTDPEAELDRLLQLLVLPLGASPSRR